VFVGPHSATAFGDYAAGSNHVLPTGGAGRFQGPLDPGVFRRRIPTVTLTQGAARELAPTVATLARAEGFPLHAESAEARAEE
jgi:histidinol dehydrogenase